MRIDIQKVVREGGLLEASTSIGPLDWERGAALELEPVSVKGRLSRMSRGYELEATVRGGLTIECVRCLSPFPLPLLFDFRLLFVSGGEGARSGESQIHEGDCDLYPCADGKFDFTAVIREQIYLHIPLKPVCNELCRGLCLICGESLDRGTCRCRESASVRVV